MTLCQQLASFFMLFSVLKNSGERFFYDIKGVRKQMNNKKKVLVTSLVLVSVAALFALDQKRKADAW